MALFYWCEVDLSQKEIKNYYFWIEGTECNFLNKERRKRKLEEAK
jgi:hypothetical protein